MSAFGDDLLVPRLRLVDPSPTRERDYNGDAVLLRNLVSTRAYTIAEVKAALDLSDRWGWARLLHHGGLYVKEGFRSMWKGSWIFGPHASAVVFEPRTPSCDCRRAAWLAKLVLTRLRACNCCARSSCDGATRSQIS